MNISLEKSAVMKAEANQNYKILDANNSLQDDLIAIRVDDNLEIYSNNNTSLIIEDFYQVCTDDQCSVEVGGEEESFQIKADNAPVPVEGQGIVVYSNGEIDQALLSLSQNNIEILGLNLLSGSEGLSALQIAGLSTLGALGIVGLNYDDGSGSGNTRDTSSPVITSSATTITIDENSGASLIVYTATATDNVAITRYSLGGIDSALFSIDSTSGEVTLTSEPDFETQSSYSFDVIVSDAAGNTDTQTITLTINNLDDTDPIITSSTSAISIDENSGIGQVIYTVTATDNVAVTSYSLSGTDAALFSVNSTSGEVSLTGDPDFETQSSYSFEVTASDVAGNTDTQTVTLNVNDIEENTPVAPPAEKIPPVITSSATATAINENSGGGQVIYTVTATDNVAVTSYSLSGTHAALFSIDSANGEVTLTDNPDFETQSNYSFDVIASDSAGNTAAKTVTLTINDVEEIDPVITSPATATAIDENSGAGQVIYTVTATDNVAVTSYSLSGTDAALFSIDSANGEVTLTGDPDFETQSSYSFDVNASDAAGNTGTQTITLIINDLDDTEPVITSSTTATTIDENSGAGQIIYIATATDNVAVTNYSLSGTHAALFSIDSANGEVTLTSDPDFENQSSYSFDVTASDAAGNTDTETVTLNINDVDEIAPVITSPAIATAIDENSGASQVIYTATAADNVAVTSYSLSGTHAALFSIDSANGEVTLTGDPDFETQSSYSFDVNASDAAGNIDTQAVTLTINDVDETAPTITSSTSTTAINEHSGASQLVYTAIATDNVAVTSYSLSGTDAALFSINSADGEVTLTDNPDFETQSSYSFDVNASDAAGNTGTQTITLNINNIATDPVELSNIEAGTGGFVINGVGTNNRSGTSVSSAGDVNGDGLADFIVGANLDRPNGAASGASFVVFGKTDTTAVELSDIESGSGGFVINGVSIDDESGISVSTAGDVNGDGLTDLIVGAFNDDPNGFDSGASFVVFGKTDNTAVELSDIEAGTGGFVINGVSADDHSGVSVSSAGDVNGDGLADLIVGAYYDDPNGSNSGASFVVFGKTDTTAVELSDIEAGTGGFVINGVSADDESGHSVSDAGDVNGDGLADLIIGANYDDPNGSDSGASFVVFGKTDGTAIKLSDIESGTGGFVINGVSADDESGGSVSSAGDVNGDGLADLIVGAAYDEPNGTKSGASFVVFGKADTTAVELSAIETGVGGFIIKGANGGDLSGFSVSSAGDVNGDGLSDLIIGATDDDPNGSNSGASFVVFGKTDTTAVELLDIESGIGGFVINGVSQNDKSGQSVSSAGDVNGDGFDDLIVGASLDDPNGSNSGTSFIVFGGIGSSATIGTSGGDTLTGDTSANQLVAGAGDDELIGNGGADVLRGGEGDDILAISDLTFASLDGGFGTDTLRLDTALSLDFSSLSNTAIDSIEEIDLTTDGGNSSLALNLTDVLNLSEETNVLSVFGNAGDTVTLNSTSNGQTGSWTSTNFSGVDTYIFTSGGDVLATVLIDDSVSTSVI